MTKKIATSPCWDDATIGRRKYSVTDIVVLLMGAVTEYPMPKPPKGTNAFTIEQGDGRQFTIKVTEEVA
jgi:hypothetical protein